MQIAMNVLKAGLSRYVARARAGEAIVITSHDKPVARLVGIPSSAAPGVSRLLSKGAAVWSGGKPILQPPVRLAGSGRSVSEIVKEERR